MKNKISKLIVALVVILTSCGIQEDALFEDSSANRIDEALVSINETLCSASNGWLMKYYPSATQEYGGYNVLVKFTADGKVEVASEIAEVSTKASSLYSLKQSAGPVLTFDTYNDVFHYFSDPRNPDGIGTNGTGMGGDFEFTVQEATTSYVNLKGKKRGSYVVLTPLDASTNWESYLTELEEKVDEMSFSKYKFVIGSTEIPASISYRRLTFTYEENGVVVTKNAPFIMTPEGFEFYTPQTILGNTISTLLFNPSEGEFGGFTGEGGIKMYPVIPDISEQFLSGNWFFAYSQMGSNTKLYWNNANVNGLAKIGEEMYYGYLGKASNGSFAFNFGCTDGSGLYTGSLIYNTAIVSENQVTLSFALSGLGNGVWYYNNALFNYLINPIGTTGGRTFTITADDYKSPTWVKLVEDAAPTTNFFTLYKAAVYYPFKN